MINLQETCIICTELVGLFKKKKNYTLQLHNVSLKHL